MVEQFFWMHQRTWCARRNRGAHLAHSIAPCRTCGEGAEFLEVHLEVCSYNIWKFALTTLSTNMCKAKRSLVFAIPRSLLGLGLTVAKKVVI